MVQSALPGRPSQDVDIPAGADSEKWVFVCHASSCRYDGAEATASALAKEMARNGGGSVARSGCLGLCSSGPAVASYPTGDMHGLVSASDAPEFVAALNRGQTLKRRAVRLPPWYRDHLLQRLRSFVTILRRQRATPAGPPAGQPAGSPGTFS